MNENLLLSLEDAFHIFDEHLSNLILPESEIKLIESTGMYLSRDVLSKVSLPFFNRSAMDGFAVISEDVRDEYDVIEVIPAGKWPEKKLCPGQAARIMTGAPVPEGGGKVIKIENTDGGEKVVQVHKHDDRINIAAEGEDIKAGDQLFKKGTLINSKVISALSATGNNLVNVYRRIKVSIIVTGDELATSLDELEKGRILDVNGPMLKSLALERGMNIIRTSMTGDSLKDLSEAVAEAYEDSDLILLTGGVSMGDYDYVKPALRENDFSIIFEKLAIKPGKPNTFAIKNKVVALGLPGNPVSVFLGFHLFALRALSLMSSAHPQFKAVKMPLAENLTNRESKRDSFLPCRLNGEGQLEIIDLHSSGHILALSQADGFVRLNKESRDFKTGEKLSYYSV